MNEQIETLGKAAGYDMINKAAMRALGFDVEKFAQLIVRECAQVSEDDISDGDACCTNTADRIARQIKKHFGVEE